MATLTTLSYCSFMAELIGGMLVAKVALGGAHGTGLVLRMHAARIIVPVIRGVGMTDLADAIIQRCTHNIGTEYGGLWAAAEGPFDGVSDQPQVSGLLTLGRAVVPIVANGAIGDLVVFGKNKRP
jgi:hypothetical protein